MTDQNGAALALPESVEQALVNGDLASLTPSQRVVLYEQTCGSLGLNPLTTPFAYLRLNNKLVLYATRNCTDQLRKVHNVDVQLVSSEQVGDLYVVKARARLANGRADEDMGAVSVAGLRGENLANAMMKATTKAKRRVTLSICGLSLLDETEAESIPGAYLEPVQPVQTVPQLAAPESAPVVQTEPVEKSTAPVTDWDGEADPTPAVDAQLEADLDAAFRAQAPTIRFPRNAPGMQEFIKLVELARPNGLGLDANARRDALEGKSVNGYMTLKDWQEDPAALDKVWALLEARVLATEAAEVAATE